MKSYRKKLLLLCLTLSMAVVAAACAKAPTGSVTVTEITAATPDETVVSAMPDAQASATENAESTESRSEETITYSTATQEATAPSAEEILNSGSSDPNDIYDATGFVSVSDVIPDAVLDIRYASDYNFVGDVINGYEEPLAILTKEAAVALMEVNDSLKEQGYRIKIYDAYRPQRAVNHFVSWSNDWSDTRMKSDFYPELDKSVLFEYGYIAYSSGHSRGSTIDLTLVDDATGEDVDMGGTFDYFGSLSHPDYTGISSEQYNNRMILRSAMINGGFSPLSTEWWHFTLSSEPYPYTYFDFPVSSASLNN